MSQPTAPELLNLAATEDDPDERALLLRAAEAAALDDRSMCGSYLVLVAEAHAKVDDDENAQRVLELAAEHATNVHDFRGAARLWAQLGDDRRALETLEQYETILRNDPGPGYLWRLLAEGFANDLGDADGVARCLARASVSATSVDDHCSVATGLWELAEDREGAREALQRATARAEEGGERQAWWTIANGYLRMGDTFNVRSTLLHGSEVARSVDEHLVMAAAWHSSFPAVPQVVEALRAAQALSKNAGEYLDVAEANLKYGGGEAAVRESLEAALSCCEWAEDRSRVARGFRQWLGDHVRADKIAPSGVRPDLIATDRAKLSGWTADATSLFDWFRPQMTHERLTEIARADYGMDFERHLVALQEIVESGLIPQPLDWHPQEVLHLTRWTQGVNVDHALRGFASAVICLAEAESGAGSDADAVLLLDSCIELSDEAASMAVGLFAWLVEATAWQLDDGPEYEAAATVALLLAAGRANPADERLDALADLALRTGGVHALFADGMRNEIWRRLATDILPHVVAAQPDATHTAELLHSAHRTV